MSADKVQLVQVNLNPSKSPQSPIYLNICPKFSILHLHFIYNGLAMKKGFLMEAFLNLGWKDSNLRNAWTKTRCLTTWRHPIRYVLILIAL